MKRRYKRVKKKNLVIKATVFMHLIKFISLHTDRQTGRQTHRGRTEWGR